MFVHLSEEKVCAKGGGAGAPAAGRSGGARRGRRGGRGTPGRSLGGLGGGGTVRRRRTAGARTLVGEWVQRAAEGRTSLAERRLHLWGGGGGGGGAGLRSVGWRHVDSKRLGQGGAAGQGAPGGSKAALGGRGSGGRLYLERVALESLEAAGEDRALREAQRGGGATGAMGPDCVSRACWEPRVPQNRGCPRSLSMLT